VNGGAIAIGHPVGAGGGRITITLMYELRRRGGGYGVAAICGALAQESATILKVSFCPSKEARGTVEVHRGGGDKPSETDSATTDTGHKALPQTSA